MAETVRWNPLGAAAVAMDEAQAGGVAPFPPDVVAAAVGLDLGPGAVALAREIVALAGERTPESARALLLLVLSAVASSAEGSTRLGLRTEGRLGRLLDALGADAADRAAVEALVAEARQAVAWKGKGGRRGAPSGLSEIVGAPGDYRPLVLDGDHLYLQRMHDLEGRVSARLAVRIDAGPGTDDAAASGVAAALEDVKARPMKMGGPSGEALVLSDAQEAAVRAGLRGALSVVSGLPGSGKTSIVATLLRVLVRLGVPPAAIALAAPTGKAADRMRGSITSQLSAIADPSDADRTLLDGCPAAATLHRTLGYSPFLDRFRHHEGNPLSERVVIVDECSMIDLALMDRLLRAVGPGARLVLLGDADQLPSVDAGAVFRDLCRARRLEDSGQVVVLTESHRAEASEAGWRILAVAAAINRGDADAVAAASSPRAAVADLAYAGVEHLSPAGPAEREAFLADWDRRIREGIARLETGPDTVFEEGTDGFEAATVKALGALHEEMERRRILCVTRIPAGGTGATAVNAWFHGGRLADARRRGEVVGQPHFLPGEPVLVTRNDYARGLYNGDSGIVLRVRTAGEDRPEPMAVFPRAGSFAAFPLEALRGRLELAWATTVHKAQGSEYDHVALMLPDERVRLLTREVLYTAVTRARGSVTIVGTAERLAEGVRVAIERDSGVADGLSHA